ncbi:GNAT family N-acetyltransferase [Natronoglycomyces albus]|uniref:GNAT family N-acetyltransferase n=1 Tax=Natronoglycomyces albus TaxID=2811108 RepID=A0A895XH00_9ACTN|nr:GNAT family N-acetyltransferase [Natronoglycomyces albus]QSB04624.1 GNAT family N-acetyltransferase [Natronoglycomyces albus]
MPTLTDPDVTYQAAFLSSWDDFAAAGEEADQLMGAWSSRNIDYTRDLLATEDGFTMLVADLLSDRSEIPESSSMVPHSALWWVEGDRWIGRTSIRHELNGFLLEMGGHIGYSVRPGERGKGHATAILAASLAYAAGLGIEEVLVTCSDDNIASRRTIEANGGALEDERHGRLRYWIATA